ncbi:divergent PAP2 family protein [Candidatus Saccharibacteria bacterium]|nr:divergent PAP2 family protein [Candidatus Saccharibacteria bacterium]
MLPSILVDILANRYFMIALVALVLAQVLKTFYNYWRTKSWKKTLLYSTGGMPSSHSALAVSLMVAVGLYDGFRTPLFAMSAVLALVVLHDAVGIRRAAGQQAEAINFLAGKLEKKHGIKLGYNLKELLGHQPIEVVAGGILGLIVALVMYWLIPL